MNNILLNDSISNLKSVGQKRAAIFEKLGILTIADLIEYFPRDYLDRSEISKIANLQDGQMASIRAIMRGHPEVLCKGQKTITKITFSDDTGHIGLVWFNQPYMRNNFAPNAEYLISGKVKTIAGKITIENPECENVPRGTFLEALSGGRIVPIYALTSGISQKVLRGLINQALVEVANQIADFMPQSILSAHDLCDRAAAIRNIHFPQSSTAYFAARRRLVFEELFMMQAALLYVKGHGKISGGRVFESLDAEELVASLPFKLTDDQNKVIEEISRDIAAGYVVNRLIQGDVGSGKTAVAMIMCYIAAKNNVQSALMAPTETLATQHYHSFTQTFQQFGIKCKLLTGSMKAKEKKAVIRELLDGEIDIIIGTHALIQDSVEFADLGLVITDEQHRFGVRQRARLNSKGAHPHVLVMTATPIPRSLAMVLYGDMDISTINQLPPGRQKIDTYCVKSTYHNRIFKFIKSEVEKGRQAYIICPLVEESEAEGFEDLKSVMDFAQMLKSGPFNEISLEILHGRMKPEEKSEIMTDFSKGETKILVSTTVIEVGINVPNATVILIENAERFGLSQLHQLRGRVGRYDLKSYCILVTDSENHITKKRMKAMTDTNDGFELSELDLELRGPGEFFGTMQHGIPAMRLANLYKDMALLAETNSAVAHFFEVDPKMFHVEHFALRDRIMQIVGNFEKISL